MLCGEQLLLLFPSSRSPLGLSSSVTPTEPLPQYSLVQWLFRNMFHVKENKNGANAYKTHLYRVPAHICFILQVAQVYSSILANSLIFHISWNMVGHLSILLILSFECGSSDAGFLVYDSECIGVQPFMYLNIWPSLCLPDPILFAYLCVWFCSCQSFQLQVTTCLI